MSAGQTSACYPRNAATDERPLCETTGPRSECHARWRPLPSTGKTSAEQTSEHRPRDAATD
eukprot:14808736-Alexandrium_andersonii.AAC.1